MDCLRVPFIAIVILVGSSLQAATITVDLNGGADYTDIQSACDAARGGLDTVVVKPGLYEIAEPINFNRLHDPDDPRSPLVKDIKVKSEAGAALTTIRMSDSPLDANRASVVIFENCETKNTNLQGFTIENGAGTAVRPNYYIGGGILCTNRSSPSVFGSSPSVMDCVITGNHREGDYIRRGGAVMCMNFSSPTFTNCTLSNNQGCNAGGGLYSDESSSPTMRSCTIVGNLCGGGVYLFDGTMIDCTVTENCGKGDLYPCEAVSCMKGKLIDCKITGNFGGLAVRGNLEVTNCTISGNGGGVFCGFDDLGLGKDATFTNCTISGNLGGGVSCGPHTYSTFNRCAISGNRGVGFTCRSPAVKLINSTVMGNWADTGGGGGVLVYEAMTIINCTIAGNSSDGIRCVYSEPSKIPTLQNCLFWGNTSNTLCGNITSCLSDRDPLFLKKGRFDFTRFKKVVFCYPDEWPGEVQMPDFIVEEPDFHLQAGSPAIDAGTLADAPGTDFDGVARPQGANVDIGAYEFWDCNGNGVQDNTDVARGTSKDCNGNNVPDECDLSRSVSKDCNGNEIPDECDIASGTSNDVNQNLIPDSCEPDCNGNGVPDSYEIAQGAAKDCNGNGVPDACDIASGTSKDLDGDGIPDECGGLRIPGDANGDGRFDISDALAALGVFFLGIPSSFPCGDGTPRDPANVSLIDWQPDGMVDISDAVAMLNFLFLGGNRHALAVPGAETKSCVRIVGCSDSCGL